MFDEENQMGLFEIAGVTPDRPIPPQAQSAAPQVPSAPPVRTATASPAKKAAAPARRPAAPAPARTAPAAPAARTATPAPARRRGKAPAPAAAKKVSGLVPEGDVRLTANIRQDLHLKLKIASAHRRTTIGEIIEELIENYL